MTSDQVVLTIVSVLHRYGVSVNPTMVVDDATIENLGGDDLDALHVVCEIERVTGVTLGHEVGREITVRQLKKMGGAL